MSEVQSAQHEHGSSSSAQSSLFRPNKDLSLKTRLYRRLTVEIDPKWGDMVLVGCFFCAGLVDSVAYHVYSCFVSMQTGNTIFVSLGIAQRPDNSPSFAWAKSLTAIIVYLIGALFFGTFHRKLSPLKRWVITASFAIQTALIIVAASLVQTRVVSYSHTNLAEKERHMKGLKSGEKFPWLDLLPIGLLAFQSAGQVVASRVLKHNALPTMVLTTLYTDLMMDLHLVTAGIFEDPQRNRRAGGVVMLFAGALIAGFMARSWPGFAGVLWLAAFVKSMMVLAWFLWKPVTVVGESEARDNG